MVQVALVWLLLGVACSAEPSVPPKAKGSDDALKVGAAAVNLQADDAMEIGGSIGPGLVQGQEGELRAVAVVAEKAGQGKLAIVACDVLMLTRDLLDPAVAEIERTCGIPSERVLINATHTHHAPSTVTVHGYARNELFCRRVQQGIIAAVQEADRKRSENDCRLLFRMGEEKSVGQNSRLLLGDGTIFWIGDRSDAVKPTGPFDPQLPVLAFRDRSDKLIATVFNHSTHTIGTRKARVRSPSFYGLAAQELEAELGGTFSFLEGASGSTHNLGLTPVVALDHIKEAVRKTLAAAEPRAVARIAGIRRPFRFRVAKFDESREDEAVSSYVNKRAAPRAEMIRDVFRKQREVLRPHQGEERQTWLQVMVIGDVAIVGVPAEFFTKLGLDIKRQSPFPNTIVAELANDWIGYLPDREAFQLGGYQTWIGLHSYAEPGTGERVVDEVVAMLREVGAAPRADHVAP